MSTTYLSDVLRQGRGGYHVYFRCPGCNADHLVLIHGRSTFDKKGWAWNNNAEKPTFNPSILVTSGHYVPGYRGECWCKFNDRAIAQGKSPAAFKCTRCHLYVRDGMLQFLDDCSHALAGKTVPMVTYTEETAP